MVGSISVATGNVFHEFLRSIQKEQEEALGATISEARVAQVEKEPPSYVSSDKRSSSNIMSRNFASATREQSKFRAARKAGQEAVSIQANRQMAILNVGLAQLNALSAKDSENYAIRNLIGKKTARRMMEESQQTVREESERNLEEIKQTIEEKSREALSPKDKNGKQIEASPTGATGGALPMPEISGSDSAPAADMAPAPAASAIPAPDAVAPSVTQSIDITV